MRNLGRIRRRYAARIPPEVCRRHDHCLHRRPRPARARHRPGDRAGDRRGRKRLPALGRQLGGGMREFKDSVTSRADKHSRTTTTRGRARQAALGRPDGEETPLDGEVVRERSLAPAPRAPRSSTMATRLKPIGHDDRLSLVEHLDELRTRIIICVVGVRRRVRRSACGRTTGSSTSSTGRSPTAQSKKPCDETRDPLEQADCSQQAQKRLNEQIAEHRARAGAVGRDRARAARAGRGALGRRRRRRRQATPRGSAAPAGDARRRRAAHRDADRRAATRRCC